MSGPYLIEAKDLGVARGDRILFKGLNLAAGPGEAVALRGANGAGKTTLLRTLAGLTRPETGEVRLASFHWVGHRDGLKPNETPAAHLRHWALAWGAPQTAIPDFLDRMGLSRPADVPARFLSAGQRRRTALARLLLKERPVWLLDEPYAALDAEGRGLVEALIRHHLGQGGAVAAAIHGEAGFAAAREIAL